MKRQGGIRKDKKTLNAAVNSGKKPKSLSFDAFYEDVFGTNRWKTLRRALLAVPVKVAVWNKHCQLLLDDVATENQLEVLHRATDQQQEGSDDENKSATAGRNEPSSSPYLLTVLRESPTSEARATDSTDAQLLAQPPRDKRGIAAYYLLDMASAMIVEHLRVEGHHKVLDLCASPGGKSVCIGQFLSSVGVLTSNEQKPDRCARLRRNLEEHIPESSFTWAVSQRDGTTWYNPCMYDRVLVDAPCSSERHLLHQPGGISTWSAATSLENARIQTALLLRALESAVVSGVVVYSTCSISPHENDGVVEETLRRTRCGAAVVMTRLPVGEATRLGWIILPDVCANAGPMFCATLRKTAEHRVDSSSSSSQSSSDEDEPA
jgi:16S rRNA C967 or C1407 C5-methylase (RsmB/RsmF family)